MGTVLTGLHIGRLLVEIIAVYIVPVPVAVAVVILTGRTVQFGLVHPHVALQVLVSGENSRIHDGDDYRRVAGTVHLPCLEQPDIGPLDSDRFAFGIGHRTVVVVMPLHLQTGVIERHLAGTALPGGRFAHLRRQRIIGTVQCDYPINRLCMPHAGQCSKLLLRTGYGHLVAEPDIKPEMEPVFPVTFLEPGVGREHFPYLGRPEAGRKFVE